ncbi:MAG: rhomboid family intramembrane serine protease [Planctomycetota bacterium]
MEPIAIVNLMIVGLTAWTSYRGLTDGSFRDRMLFSPEHILRDKQHERLLTSGLVHADWIHFGFNMFSLYSFGRLIELEYGAHILLAIYVSAILGGSLLSLGLHRHHEYRALGASGGVCGVIFAAIFLLPGGEVVIFPLPFGIPASIYAVVFVVVSFIGMRKQIGNVGHDAHLGGAIVGLLVATAMFPSIVTESPWLYAAIMVGSAGLGAYHYLVPAMPGRGNPFARALGQQQRRRRTEQKQQQRRQAEDEELDRLLDKVSREGMHSLSDRERRRLQKISKHRRDD